MSSEFEVEAGLLRVVDSGNRPEYRTTVRNFGQVAGSIGSVNVGAPILDIVPGARGRILQALCWSQSGASGREIARRAGVPGSTAAPILLDLAAAGVVLQEPGVPAYRYSLNRAHVLVAGVLALVGAHASLLDHLRMRIAEWSTPPVAAWMYGSTARGDGDRDSDIDLLFVLPDGLDEEQRQRWHDEQAAPLMEDVFDRTGNQASYLWHTVDTFLEMEATRSAFSANLHAEGIDLLPDSSSWRRVTQAHQAATT